MVGIMVGIITIVAQNSNTNSSTGLELSIANNHSPVAQYNSNSECDNNYNGTITWYMVTKCTQMYPVCC